MLTPDFTTAVDDLIKKAPSAWLDSACNELRSFPATASAEFVIQRQPSTNNPALSFLFADIVRKVENRMSWEALSWVLESTATAYGRWQNEQRVELLWAGPSPANQIAARRIDQVLYDLIGSAQREILLVTFAANKIQRLTDALVEALLRGVTVKLILEFEEESKGQLSYDAINAFPAAIQNQAEIYYWPMEKRGVNAYGKPGKLHAKAAVVDDQALIASANLTDDAFNRNMELGALFVGSEVVENLRRHLDTLIASHILVRWHR